MHVDLKMADASSSPVAEQKEKHPCRHSCDHFGCARDCELLPSGAHIVKAFNTTLAGTLVKGEVDGKKLDVFVASDSEEAKQTVMKLVDSAGIRALDAGALKYSRQLEGMALLNIMLQSKYDFGWMSAWKLLV